MNAIGFSGQELSEGEEAVYEDLVRAAKDEELDTCESCGDFEALEAGDPGKSAVDARWVLA